MSQPILQRCQKGQKCVVLLCHTLFPRNFSGTITDRDITNTLLEPLRPADVPFGGFVDIAPHLGVKSTENPNFGGVNRRFQAKRAKYWKFHIFETTASISTKFCVTMETIKWSSSNRRPANPRWRTAAILKKPFNRHISATVWPILIRFGTVTHIGLLQRNYR